MTSPSSDHVAGAEMTCFKQNGHIRYYHFACPSCGEHGDLGLDENDIGTFQCPAECGATFLEYKALTNWCLRCVVQPVYERTEP